MASANLAKAPPARPVVPAVEADRLRPLVDVGGVPMTLDASSKEPFAVDAAVEFGKIANQFPLKRTEKSVETRLIGTTGDGDAGIQVKASFGNITIAQGN